ncbi:MAG: phosphoenolpyruvate synthase [Pseudomonadales bacterium]|nr:phosphoenolpyruvate synthase [Pseudomonadales bacterium]
MRDHSNGDILWFDQVSISSIGEVGGKNASLGEMYCQLSSQGIKVPFGFATTAGLFRAFITNNQLEEPIANELEKLGSGQQNLQETGIKIRQFILDASFSETQKSRIAESYKKLCEKIGVTNLAVAVRSSATAEDLPEASFAGQQESYLNITGTDALLEACKNCFASLYTDRAIAYREEKGFRHDQVLLSVGVQQMVESGAAGVMFTLDTESGFPDAILINAAFGLGETLVKGSVTPDRYMVYKPFLDKPALKPVIEVSIGNKHQKMLFNTSGKASTVTVETTKEERASRVLNDNEIMQLANWANAIEKHYHRAMDIEWARDAKTQQLYIVQARPETIESNKDRHTLVTFQLKEKSAVLAQGASVGSSIASGCIYKMEQAGKAEDFPAGGILLTERTDPDWVPVMRKAAGIITDTGGPTSHAAIVSRELKVPAIVGCGNATQTLTDHQSVTLSCAEGSTGYVYDGELSFSTHSIQLADIPATRTKLMINAALPDGALQWWQLPVQGIGLTRIEFIISSQIRVHPMALLHPEKVSDPKVSETISDITHLYDKPEDFFVETLARSIGKIAASRYPDPVIVRMSDFKSNEYRGLIGGEYFEIEEENPMLGFRGASRYYHPLYREGFELECKAIKYAREVMGFSNIIVMIPFCRTPAEADKVLEVMAGVGLTRGSSGLQVYVMCEIPSNVILAREFAQRFDGFSIGSNDLTQLVLGIDRDSALLKELFDARNDAVKSMIAQVIDIAHQNGCKVGICGQAPSDHPEFAEFLVECGIDSISLNPDSVFKTSHHIAEAEKRQLK